MNANTCGTHEADPAEKYDGILSGFIKATIEDFAKADSRIEEARRYLNGLEAQLMAVADDSGLSAVIEAKKLRTDIDTIREVLKSAERDKAGLSNSIGHRAYEAAIKDIDEKYANITAELIDHIAAIKGIYEGLKRADKIEVEASKIYMRYLAPYMKPEDRRIYWFSNGLVPFTSVFRGLMELIKMIEKVVGIMKWDYDHWR
jgi:hypothetical protein